MTYKARVVSETLSDGSQVWNVHFAGQTFHAVTMNDAYNLVDKLVDAFAAHTVDAVESAF